MQTNDLGLDEFMELCKLIDVEPYISVNAGWATRIRRRKRSST